MMNDEYERVIERLQSIASGEGNRKIRTLGLCYNIGAALSSSTLECKFMVGDITKTIMKAWPKYSGNPNYPIPGDGTYSAMDTYYNCKDLYDLTTSYGRLRIELAEYLIVELTKLIEKD